jgi:hypothetical protein
MASEGASISQVTQLLASDGTAMLRELMHSYVDRCTAQEQRVSVIGADGVERSDVTEGFLSFQPNSWFLGRKIYIGAVMVLATALQHGPSQQFGDDAGGAPRWWSMIFPVIRFWTSLRDRFVSASTSQRW